MVTPTLPADRSSSSVGSNTVDPGAPPAGATDPAAPPPEELDLLQVIEIAHNAHRIATPMALLTFIPSPRVRTSFIAIARVPS